MGTAQNIYWKNAIIKLWQADWTIELTPNRKAYAAVSPKGERWIIFWHGNEASHAREQLHRWARKPESELR